jgi:predicted secreted hydrolase
METDAEVYRPTSKEDGYHSAPYEWWYADAIFDNGYAVRSLWFTGNAGSISNPEPRHVHFMISDPAGKVLQANPRFTIAETSASTKGCDVSFGASYLRGEFPRWELKFKGDAIGASLTFDNISQGLREPPDGCLIGRTQEPPTRHYFTWVLYPRSTVSGKLIVNGKEIAVRGDGYSDHQWGNIPVQDVFESHFWGRIHLPGHTLVYWDAPLSEKLGYQRLKRLWVLKGEKLISYLKDDIYVDSGDLTMDEFGVTIPRKLVLIISSSRVRGTVTHKIGHLIQKSRGGSYAGNSFISDCAAKLEIDGEKVEATQRNLHTMNTYVGSVPYVA